MDGTPEQYIRYTDGFDRVDQSGLVDACPDIFHNPSDMLCVFICLRQS